MMDHYLNRMNYYQDSLKRFIKSDRPLMLIIGQHGSGKKHLVNHFCENTPHAKQILKIHGHEELQPADIIRSLSQHWRLYQDPEINSYRHQLDNLLNQFKQKHTSNILIVTNAHHLNVASLASLCHLASIQEKPPVMLHLILIGQVNLEDRIISLMANSPPSLLLQPLSKKETFQYIRHRLQKFNKSPTITPSADIMEKIYEHSGGFPSLINHLLQQQLYNQSLKKKESLDFKPLPQDAPTQQPDTSIDKSTSRNQTIKIALVSIFLLVITGGWVYQHQISNQNKITPIALNEKSKPKTFHTLN